MHTVILKNTPRKTTQGRSYSIQVVGNSPAKEALMQSIRELENHPASSAQRSLIDMLDLIEKHNLQIRHTEHSSTEDDLETWLFVLQG
jgi:hypothetical protein